jgi:hypothetical protein
MSATRSGIIYSKVSKTNVEPKTNVELVSISIPKTPTPIMRNNNRPSFFEPEPITDEPTRSARPNRTQFSPAVLRELCSESDNDSTSSYDSDDAAADNEDQQYYMTHMQPKYAVSIDFDEASKAWRENKRRQRARETT